MDQNRKEEKNNKIKEITEQLHTGIQELFESDRYKEYLKTMSKFTNYSFNNTLLIAMQRPDTQAVAGYRAWQSKFHRQVKKGSKGIAIIEPAPYKKKVQEAMLDSSGNVMRDEHGKEISHEVEKIIQGFKVGYVFAYEDTEGVPLPEIVSMLEQKVEDYETFIQILEAISPAPILFEKIESGVNGYYDLSDRTIHVEETLSELQKIKTAIHEMAHALLHDKINGQDQEANKNEREVCAESVAYTVASYLGLDTSEYSFGYIAGWSQNKNLKELKEKMDLIRRTADQIITGIEKELMKRNMEQAEAVAFKNGTGYLMIHCVENKVEYDCFHSDFSHAANGRINIHFENMNDAITATMELLGTNLDMWEPFHVETLMGKFEKREIQMMEREDTKQCIRKRK